MNFLEEKILREGEIRQGNILKIDNFLNHQIDIDIMRQIAYAYFFILAIAWITKLTKRQPNPIFHSKLIPP